MKIGKLRSKTHTPDATTTSPESDIDGPASASASASAPLDIDESNADTSLDESQEDELDDANADADADGGDDEQESADLATVPSVAETPLPLQSPVTSAATRPIIPSIAEQAAREAVERVLANQAEAKLFDLLDGNRILLTLQPDDIATYRASWDDRNSAGIGKIPFSEYLSLRLRACRDHTAVRPIYVTDAIRQRLEALFDEVVTSAQDLANKVDRHIRPIIESPNVEGGILRLEPLDPMLLELVTGWFPEKTPAKALGDFVMEAALSHAGLR